jgi:hypothetical protein
VSTYAKRYRDFPRPVVNLGRGRTLLWLRTEILAWARKTGRIESGGRGCEPIRILTAVDVPIWLAQPGVGAQPYIGPGESVTLDWFLPRTPDPNIGSFTGSCSSVVHRHPQI